MQILPTSNSAMIYATVPPKRQGEGQGQSAPQNPQNRGNLPLAENQTAQTPQEDVQTARILAELKAADREVRAHEAAHMAAGGALAGAASYTYKTGPDGKQYAVAGEVPIKMGKGKTPQETLMRAEQVRAAALAPAKPSAQDYKVAQSAAAMKMEAQMEILKLKEEEMKQKVENQKNGVGMYQSIQNQEEKPSFSVKA